MQGNIDIPFSELFADTVAFHGVAWAKKEYTRKGMSQWEFNFWLAGYYKQPVCAL